MGAKPRSARPNGARTAVITKARAGRGVYGVPARKWWGGPMHRPNGTSAPVMWCQLIPRLAPLLTG
jgi:hypothetical protein